MSTEMSTEMCLQERKSYRTRQKRGIDRDVDACSLGAAAGGVSDPFIQMNDEIEMMLLS